MTEHTTAHIERAAFVARENRFVATVTRRSGEVVRAYVPNTARLTDLLRPGVEVVLERSVVPTRRTDWTLTRVWDGTWVAVEAGRAADLVGAHLGSGATLPGWPAVVGVERERTVGSHRFDLEVALSSGERAIVEVKSLSGARGGLAPLSATPSSRGVAQLATLAHLAGSGQRVAVAFVVQRGDVDALDLTAEADPGWHRAVQHARQAGVHVVAYRCEVTPTTTRLGAALPIRDRDVRALAAVYLDSRIELQLPGGTVALRARCDGATPGELPAGLPAGTHTLHIVTACNPYSAPLPAHRNAERNGMLAAALAAQGMATIPALSRAPAGGWQEPGFAVLDGDRAAVLDLARRFEQHAIYELTATGLVLRWTDTDLGSEQRGWEPDARR